MLTQRNIYARIIISEESIRTAVERDRELSRRMSSLSDKHKAKTWGRIRSQRWWKVINQELQSLIEDIRAFKA